MESFGTGELEQEFFVETNFQFRVHKLLKLACTLLANQVTIVLRLDLRNDVVNIGAQSPGANVDNVSVEVVFQR